MATKLPKKKTAAQAAAFSGPEPRREKPNLEVVTTKNLNRQPSGVTVPLQLKISAELRREFKGHAVSTDMTASELFEMVWERYKQTDLKA